MNTDNAVNVDIIFLSNSIAFDELSAEVISPTGEPVDHALGKTDDGATICFVAKCCGTYHVVLLRPTAMTTETSTCPARHITRLPATIRLVVLVLVVVVTVTVTDTIASRCPPLRLDGVSSDRRNLPAIG
ncbi:unnamed protein product [Soboliphyme baturini]|uniref:GOLD domain-containing protein n=1 Tax=Soboliphyme baturini TaxID=241478 RepID=A0A183IEZ0_9BILA|nr:unnamed protein product [Soboliphyme baturini]